MLRHHIGLSITETQRARRAALIAASADEAGLPEDPEFRSAFVAYVEWGTRLALANSQPGAPTVPEAPVPRFVHSRPAEERGVLDGVGDVQTQAVDRDQLRL